MRKGSPSAWSTATHSQTTQSRFLSVMVTVLQLVDILKWLRAHEFENLVFFALSQSTSPVLSSLSRIGSFRLPVNCKVRPSNWNKFVFPATGCILGSICTIPKEETFARSDFAASKLLKN